MPEPAGIVAPAARAVGAVDVNRLCSVITSGARAAASRRAQAATRLSGAVAAMIPSGRLAAQIAGKARQVAQLAAGRAARERGRAGARRDAGIGPQRASIDAPGGTALERHDARGGRHHVVEVVPLAADDEVDRDAPGQQPSARPQERGADAAAAEAAEQQGDATARRGAQARASMLMVSVRRSLPAGPCIGATECQELNVLTNTTHWLGVNG